MWLLRELLGWRNESGYQNVMQLRNDGIERTILTSNLFGQTQTFRFFDSRNTSLLRDRANRPVCYSDASVACVCSHGCPRRTLAIPLLLIYMTFVLENKRFYLIRFVVPFFIVLFTPVVMYGEVFGYSLQLEPEELSLEGRTRLGLEFDRGLSRSSDVGISLVQRGRHCCISDLPPRLGIDHLLSLLQRVPDWFFSRI